MIHRLPIDLYFYLSFFLGIYDLQNLYSCLKDYRPKKDLKSLNSRLVERTDEIRSLKQYVLNTPVEFQGDFLKKISKETTEILCKTIIAKCSRSTMIHLAFISPIFASALLRSRKAIKRPFYPLDYLGIAILNRDLLPEINTHLVQVNYKVDLEHLINLILDNKSREFINYFEDGQTNFKLCYLTFTATLIYLYTRYLSGIYDFLDNIRERYRAEMKDPLGEIRNLYS